MPQDLFKRIFFVLFIPLSFILVSAQDYSGVSMEIRNESRADKSNIIDLVLVVKNNTGIPFKGNIKIGVPAGFKNILGSTVDVDLKPAENIFLPVKILVNTGARYGETNITFDLADLQNHIVAKKAIPYKVVENNTLRISSENSLIYINNPNDSVEVRARVSNLGNKKQNVTVVFKIPEATQENFFVEKKGSIGIHRDSVFVFRFMPSNSIIRGSQFTVNMAGFREPDKEIFGNASVSVQNVSSVQHYQDLQTNTFSNYTKNSITASYRNVGKNISMYQLMGSGGFNLPSGYVFMRGNIYTLNNQNDPMVNNTYVTYYRENSAFTLGNVSKLLELSLFGRGAEYALTSQDKSKKLEVGFVDQTYSLIERNSFLKNGYGFYAKGTLGAKNVSENIGATYIFRDDPYDKAKHNLLGTDFTHSFSEDWKLNTKVYGGVSFYENNNTVKPSLAVETQYSGIIEKINLNGNYFYSTDYYPGNRRGILQIQQTFSRSIFRDHYLYANITVSDFSPKFYFYNYDLKSSSTRLDMGINFRKKGNFGLGLGYQYQEERSNTYNNFFSITEARESKQLKAQRLTEYMTWTSPNKKHSSMLGIEAGLVDYPDLNRPQYQMKISGNYNYRWFNVTYIYQYGSYFLSEYAFSKMLNEATPYKKLTVSSFFNKNFFKDKVNFTSGFAYTDDALYGKSPSGFVNLKYTKERYGIYLNSSWYNYSSGNLKNNLLTIEAGVTLNLRPNTLNPGKKGSIKAFVYYDNNSNNIFDEGDKEAEGYLIMLNNTSFKTNEKGNILYTKIPYGKYALKQVIQQGWYYDEAEFEVNTHNYYFEVPLHQNGTILGKATYEFNNKTALDFDPKLGGIIFNIYQEDKFIQRMFTDDNGEFVSFLPSGNYRISLNENSLPLNTHCDQTYRDVNIQAGKIIYAEPFIIKVKEKTIRVKKFGN
ncbi:hypothetical protein [Chryseobacterium luteum]|uniref:SD-repeat containing protein B domain-containing protein n=1 Tax=Chryseobacterium luteum TaxID=421531 RepID=A0A085ZTM8_9FLAO|nr:hypothetical protein [Chryseobacterium luteum]KFF07792.1 hypothetical protein IX38_08830 [Chryseobacterium luteum]